MLPPEAGSDTDKGFEPNDDWLATADKELQVEDMREWFLSRYCDPVMLSAIYGAPPPLVSGADSRRVPFVFHP